MMKSRAALVRFYLVISSALLFVRASPTIRYLHGKLMIQEQDNAAILENHQNTTVATAWSHCQKLPECVSFGFQANARFPGDRISVFYYSVADWHVSNEPTFVEDRSWHLYVNTTREVSLVDHEINTVLKKLEAMANSDGRRSSTATSKGNLRLGGVTPPKMDYVAQIQEKMDLIIALFGIVQYKELRIPVVKVLTRPILKIAMDDSEINEVRVVALEVILSLAESYETPPILQDFGLLGYMHALIEKEPDRNDELQPVSKLALDVVCNMALHRTDEFPFRPTTQLLDTLTRLSKSKSGSVGLQATLALIHVTKETIGDNQLPSRQFAAVVDLLEAIIDGDQVFGYDWELIPGPLGAIHFLLESNVDNSDILKELVDAGLVEQLLRILDGDSMDSEIILATLKILNLIQELSQQGSEMVAMAATSIQSVHEELRRYEAPAALAGTLARKASSHKLQNPFEDQEL